MVSVKVDYYPLAVYINDLSIQLSLCTTGCLVGSSLINHLVYADDLAIVSPCSAGLQQLLKVCTQYGLEYDITFNAKNSNVMIVGSREDKKRLSLFSICVIAHLCCVKK